MKLATIQDLARLAMEGRIHTVRFASDGKTAVIKRKVGKGDDATVVETRITPTEGDDGKYYYAVDL